MWALCYCIHLQYTTSLFKAAWHGTKRVVSFGQDNRHDRSERTPPATRRKSRLNVTALVTIVKKQNKDWISVKWMISPPSLKGSFTSCFKVSAYPKLRELLIRGMCNRWSYICWQLLCSDSIVIPFFPHTFNELSWHNVRNFQSSKFCNLRVLIKHQCSLGKPGHLRDKPL